MIKIVNKNIKRFMLFLLIFSILIPTTSLNSYGAASDLYLSVSTDKDNAKAGDTIMVTISLNGVSSLLDIDGSELFGISIKMQYNQNLVSAGAISTYTLGSENLDIANRYSYTPNFKDWGILSIGRTYFPGEVNRISNLYDRNGDNKVDIVTTPFYVKSDITGGGAAKFVFVNPPGWDNHLGTINDTTHALDITRDTDVTVVCKGDIDFDGQTTRADSLLLIKHLMKISAITDPLILSAADANKDGLIDMKDQTMIDNYISGFGSLTQ